MADAVRDLTGAENVAWNLSDLYAGDDAGISAEIDAIAARADAFAETYRGRVGALSAPELRAALQEYESISEAFYKLAAYAQLRWTTETTNPAYGALFQKLNERGAQLEQKLVFFELEWASAPDEHAQALIDDPELAFYRHYLVIQRLQKPHQLTESEEKIMADRRVTGSDAWTRFFDETLSAARYEWQGEQVPFERVVKSLYEPLREVRAAAADSITKGLRANTRTLTFIFNTLLAEKASTDQLRHYKSWIESRNRANQATDESVQALIDAVTSRYDIVERYYNLKRKLLGYEELYDYDRYAPLSAENERHYHWDEAREIVLRGYGMFDERMAEIAEMFFDKQWIDGPVRPGKRGGAFSAGTTPSAHPYILVNYVGRGRDISTLAHELGHGIHQYLSRERGVLQMHTPLTTAEMASTFGEMLVFNDLLSREDNPKARLAMIASKIEDSFATIFRQVSMNRFEDAIHTARRTEGELTAERFSALWMDTQQKMFGTSVKLRDDYSIWWSYISHFLHVPGYVYAYAFGELLVLALYAKYRREGPSFVPKYVEVLSMGGSAWPHEILAKVGVDLNDPAFWKLGLAEVDALVTSAEKLAAQIDKA
jgi:oligoendopeptidase F